MKKLFTSVLFLSIIAVCIWKCGIILRPTDPDFCESQIRAFHSLETNSLDVIAYGSSHCWTSFDSVYFENETGMKTYNYGCNWQSLNTTWLFFHDSLRTQNPKVVYIEVGLADRSGYDRDVDGEIYYTRKIPDSEKKEEYIRNCFGPVEDNYERYISYYVPFVLSHENWENLNRKSFHYHPHTIEDLDKVNGFNCREQTEPVSIKFGVLQEELPDDCVSMLDDIVKTCKEKQIELCFYTIPAERGYAYDDFMAKYAKNNGCRYISFYDCFAEAGLDETVDFCDTEHVNASGARKVTDYLIKNSVLQIP